MGYPHKKKSTAEKVLLFLIVVQNNFSNKIPFLFQLDGKQAGQLTDEDDNKIPQTIKDGA